MSADTPANVFYISGKQLMGLQFLGCFPVARSFIINAVLPMSSIQGPFSSFKHFWRWSAISVCSFFKCL